MSKPLSLFYAVVAVAFMFATAIAISHNGWLAVSLALLTLVWIGSGFIVRARLRRRSQQ
ncbi:hypothetical protein PA598K_01614 [Paenibacillus sp. 598K]|uniref:DUF5325 family protein n=1 Tax=Paenibacillus sp. 598K TaxID=1117987 RepID=UPI000FF9E472|nr:DUF5325 family protein [Paenibacillus sp. 598K]GBF73327.1 hypothetical protein PA598K_01614 [Paenibacillus sp. 598K]